MVFILATRWCPGISTFSVCSYFSLNNERKVSELTPLVDLSTIFQIQPSWSCPCKVQTQEGHLLPRGPLGSNTSEPVTCQQRRKGKNQCNTGGSSGSHPSQSTPPATFWNGGVYPTTWGQLWNANRGSISRGSAQRPAVAHVFSCFVFTHLVNKHLGAPRYL